MLVPTGMREISPHILRVLLHECSIQGDFSAARQLHTIICLSASQHISELNVLMIKAYAACGSLSDAYNVFIYSERNADTWNEIIGTYAKLGETDKALDLYEDMQRSNFKPNKWVSMLILKSCSSTGALRPSKASDIMEQYGIPISRTIVLCMLEGCLKTCDLESARHIHSLMISAKLDKDSFISDHLIRVFVKCGSLHDANHVFQMLAKRTTYTWTAIISGHVDFGEYDGALHLYQEMLLKGIKVNEVVLLCILKLCTNTSSLEKGRFVHHQVLEFELEHNSPVGNTLVDMYAKCGSLDEARYIFDKLCHRDLVSWGAMITGYTTRDLGLQALQLYKQMKQQAVVPSKVILLSTLKACSSIASCQDGHVVHHEVVENGYGLDVNIGNTLVDMYAKSGCLEEAYRLFINLPDKTIVSWGVIIGGFAHHARSCLAISLFNKMQEQGIVPNEVIFLSVMKACSSIGVSRHSRIIHDQIIRCGIELDVVIGSALVDMYAKCGNPETTHKIFNVLPHRNLVTWSALIGAYARLGMHIEAEACLKDMQSQGIEPDRVILTSLLMAYSHAGLIKEGHRFFKSLKTRFNITSGVSHFNTMIDLLCRGGFLDEAKNMVASMPVSSDMVAWTAILSSCRAYGNVNIGKSCFDELLEIDTNDTAGYMLLSNIFTDAFIWDETHRIQALRKLENVIKKPDASWIEVDSDIHEFTAGDLNSHATNQKIKYWSRLVRNKGYVPDFGGYII